MAEESDLVLRMFCSVDLIGSTAAKATRQDEISPPWAKHFSDFYQEFPRHFLVNAYDSLPDRIHSPGSKLKVWKFIGDEILFYTELTDYRETLAHVWAMKEAITRFVEQWKEKTGWKLKATAWLAGFPVLNKEVELEVDGAKVRDFIGPSIDAGFRITKFATSRRFAVSIGLAMMLLDAILDTKKNSLCSLMYAGREELKGVIQGKPYPIIWIDMADGISTVEEELLGIKYESDHPKLAEFLEGFVDETPDLYRPFIRNAKGGKYSKVPSIFLKALDTIKKPVESSDRSYSPSDHDEVIDTPGTEMDEPKIKPRKKRT